MDPSIPTVRRRGPLLRNIEAVRPGLDLLELSARTGAGLDVWLSWPESRDVPLKAGATS